MNLETTYLGLDLPHPLVASSSPISKSLDGIRRLEEGGAAAIVLFSLFEEQLRQEQESFDHLTSVGTESYGESLGFFPDAVEYDRAPDDYLELISNAVEAVDVPIIASLNGTTLEAWTDYAGQIEEAGAAALELNVYHLPTDLNTTGAAVESRYTEIVRAVCETVDIPVAVKLGPYFSAPGDLFGQLIDAGASGLVLFNRFYQPDFDLEKMEVEPSLELSQSYEMRLPLLWIAVCFGRIEASLAATTGVQTGVDAAKYILAGADAVMTTSSLLRNGPDHLRVICEQLEQWMDRRDFESVRQIKGSMSRQRVADPSTFERANYIRTLQSWKNPYL
ncbi:MAG: dihydroorotate dehydrogenase-like protein [Xanthomonadales bacterium]|nr:dihydroorotate dehydrogenase-like protein [Xanthomonadales bacterium]